MAGTKDIKDFTKYPSLSDNDYILGTKTDLNGTDAGIMVKGFRKQIAEDVKPTIKNSYWWVNGLNTGILAEGKTPKIEGGETLTGESGTQALATLTSNGETEDGQPKYTLSFTIPRGSLGLPGNDGKTPILETGSVEKGVEASAAIVFSGADEEDNPKYRLDLVLPQGDSGKNPILEFDEIITGAPGSEAFAAFTPVGQTPEGNPKYSLKLTIPRGDPGLPGTGSGNISVNGSDLIRGKQYLFIPSSDGSTEGSFVEYIPFNDAELRGEIERNLQLAKTYTNEQIAGIVQFDIQVVSVLPETGKKGIIYLVPKTNTQTDAHNEYIWISDQSKYELIGTTAFDLSNYYTKDEANARYILKETSKRLMTDVEGTKLGGIEEGANKYVLPTGEGYNFIPAGGTPGQILSNVSPGEAEWVNQKSIVLFPTRYDKTISYETQPDLFNSFINGATIDDFDQAITDKIPITIDRGAYGCSKSDSVVSHWAGSYGDVIFSVSFLGYTLFSEENYCLTMFKIMLTGSRSNGWKEAKIYGKLVGEQTYFYGGNWLVCHGGLVISDVYGYNATIELDSPSDFHLMNGTTTTYIITNTHSTNTATFTLKMRDSLAAEGKYLLVIGDYPVLESGWACEVSILWTSVGSIANKYIARISEPFDYSNTIE